MSHPLRLRIGEYYDSGNKRWPGTELILTTEGCLLYVEYLSYAAEPTLDEIAPSAAPFTLRPDVIPSANEQIKVFDDDVELAWVDAEHNGILCYRFGDTPWRSIAHNPHRDTPAGYSPGLPIAEPARHISFAVGLGAPIQCVRLIDWPYSLVAAVRATVGRLVARPFDAQVAVDEANFLCVFERSEGLAQRAQAKVLIRGREAPA